MLGRSHANCRSWVLMGSYHSVLCCGHLCVASPVSSWVVMFRCVKPHKVCVSSCIMPACLFCLVVVCVPMHVVRPPSAGDVRPHFDEALKFCYPARTLYFVFCTVSNLVLFLRLLMKVFGLFIVSVFIANFII